jgi:hypothetical protein
LLGTYLPVALFVQLLGYAMSAVVLGVLDRPSFYPGVVGYAAVAVYALAIGLALRRGNGTAGRRIAAFLLVAAGAYAVIAAGRGGYAGALGVAAMARQRRFHYVGTAALAIGFCVALAQLAPRSSAWRSAASVILLLWAVSTAAVPRLFGARIAHFDSARRETTRVLRQVRTLARSAPPESDVFIENQTFVSVGPLLTGSRDKFPGVAAVFTIYHPTDLIAGRRVRFVDDPAVLEAVRADRRTGALLVAPDAVQGELHRLPQFGVPQNLR